MNSEKNQLAFIGWVILILAGTVGMFLLVGGEFEFAFIHFSAEGLLGKIIWIVPLILVAGQQLYVVPTFMKSYWKLFSNAPPNQAEIWVPMMNENAIYPGDVLPKIIYALWAVIAGAIVLMVTPVLAIFGSSVGDAMYFMGILILLMFAAICGIRGYYYFAVRRDIYDLHNKYLGIRGTSVMSWVHRLLYFIPLARSISLLSDLQVMDKLTKFNDIESMKTELFEEDR